LKNKFKMPQRRGVSKDAKVSKSIETEEEVPLAPQKPGSISLERGNGTGGGTTMTAGVSMEERFETESYNLKVKHWKESPFAVGLTEITWADEKLKLRRKDGNGGGGDDQSLDDGANCLCFSAAICPHIGASRVGNMSVLKQSSYSVEVEEEDEETGEVRLVRVVRPRLDVVVGPYWPMLLLVTYPLIIGISGWAMIIALPGQPFYLVAAWFVCTTGLIVSLALTACRDPGIMYKRHSPPQQNPQRNQAWRWNDQAQTFSSRNAVYDPDTAVVVEGFDHTCPWT
jgi:hypothetical protein